jgi:predicted transcriptional regulator
MMDMLSTDERRNRISQLRAERKFSLRQLARLLGVSHQTIATDLEFLELRPLSRAEGAKASRGYPRLWRCSCCFREKIVNSYYEWRKKSCSEKCRRLLSRRRRL